MPQRFPRRGVAIKISLSLSSWNQRLGMNPNKATFGGQNAGGNSGLPTTFSLWQPPEILNTLSTALFRDTSLVPSNKGAHVDSGCPATGVTDSMTEPIGLRLVSNQYRNSHYTSTKPSTGVSEVLPETSCNFAGGVQLNLPPLLGGTLSALMI